MAQVLTQPCVLRSPPQGVLEDPEADKHRERLLVMLMLVMTDDAARRLLIQGGWMAKLARAALPSFDEREAGTFSHLRKLLADVNGTGAAVIASLALQETAAIRRAQAAKDQHSPSSESSDTGLRGDDNRSSTGSNDSSSSTGGDGSGHAHDARASSASAAAAPGDAQPTGVRLCAACGATGPSMRCGRCRRVHFCNAACQKRAWSSHKRECRQHDQG